MKFHGKPVPKAPTEYVVIPRGDENVVIHCVPISDPESFNKLNPEPTPPEIIKPGNIRVPDFEDKAYVELVQKRNELRHAWMVIETIKSTPGMEWETVKMGDPATWANWEKELRDSGFSVMEINRIVAGVWTANGLDEAKLDKARKDFLASLVNSVNP